MPQNLWQGPATHMRAVTPSDTVELPDGCRGLFIGTAGNVVVVGVDAAGGATGVTLKNLANGQIIPIAVRRVNSTNTTATDIVALY